MARFLLSAPPATPPPPLGERLRRYLLQSWRGRILLACLLVDLLARAGLAVPGALDGLARVALFFYALVWGWTAAGFVLGRLLYRIRTKLLLSGLFIAVVPVVLLTLLFLVAGLLFGGLVASHLVSTEIDRQAERLTAQAQRIADGLEAPAEPAQARLAPLLAELVALHPEEGHAVLCPGRPPLVGGRAPRALPDWWKAPEFHGLVLDGEREVVRALRRGPRGCAVLVEAPLDEKLMAELEPRAGIVFIASLAQLGGQATVGTEGQGIKVEVQIDDDEVERRADRIAVRARKAGARGPTFVAPISRRDWQTGEEGGGALLFSFDPRAVLRRLAQGTLDFGEKLVQALGVLSVVFLAVYAVAFALGALLARSVTRSVHELSRGTQRLRQGDFEHRIPIKSRDQLGELAESFNLMAAGIQDLLRQQGEKERLEEELRIARQIQMSLLPQRAVEMSGLRVAALCLPATEVGGDYYDLLPLGPDRLAVVVADVSGKGTSAALYMAELKGLVLSLSRVHESPARLLASQPHPGREPRLAHVRDHDLRGAGPGRAAPALRARGPQPAHPPGPPARADPGAGAAGPGPGHRPRRGLRAHPRGGRGAARPRRPAGLLHGRAVRGHEPAVRAVRRAAPARRDRAGLRAAQRGAEGAHPGRDPPLRGGRGPARRHDPRGPQGQLR